MGGAGAEQPGWVVGGRQLCPAWPQLLCLQVADRTVMWTRAPVQVAGFPPVCRGRQLTPLFKIQPVLAQADMLDQEAAFVQIQEAKTMVEEDLQRRLEESEEEKQQLQQMAASAAALEQQLAQAGTRGRAGPSVAFVSGSRWQPWLLPQSRPGACSAACFRARSACAKAASECPSKAFKT